MGRGFDSSRAGQIPDTTAELIARFDSLVPVGVDEMLGSWAGEECFAGHPLDGALTAFGWQGKRFDGIEDAYPLVFRKADGALICVDPVRVAPAMPLVMRFPALKSPAVGRVVQRLLPVLATRAPRARLRMVEHRGLPTAAMVYDQLPIIDVFRRIDADSVLGWMDMRGVGPFFFRLRRMRGGG